jgi:hypothetical protein
MAPVAESRPGRGGVFRRLLAPTEAGRRNGPYLLGALGAVAFLLSLLLPWQTVTPPRGTPDDQFVGVTDGATTVSADFGDMSSFGLVYLFALVALLALVGAAVSRPELAGRFRLSAAGGAVGVLAVLIAVTTRLVDEPMGTDALRGIYGLGLVGGDTSLYKLSIGPGLFAGYAAVVLTTAAVWLAARADAIALPVARFTRRQVEVAPVDRQEPVVAPDVVGPATMSEYQRRHNDGPLDLTVTPG